MLKGSEAPDGVRWEREARTVRAPLVASYRISSRSESAPQGPPVSCIRIRLGSHVAWKERASKSLASKIDPEAGFRLRGDLGGGRSW